jgi:hypothetical protein
MNLGMRVNTLALTRSLRTRHASGGEGSGMAALGSLISSKWGTTMGVLPPPWNHLKALVASLSIHATQMPGIISGLTSRRAQAVG